jgi:hypothetical protein
MGEDPEVKPPKARRRFVPGVIRCTLAKGSGCARVAATSFDPGFRQAARCRLKKLVNLSNGIASTLS